MAAQLELMAAQLELIAAELATNAPGAFYSCLTWNVKMKLR